MQLYNLGRKCHMLANPWLNICPQLIIGRKFTHTWLTTYVDVCNLQKWKKKKNTSVIWSQNNKKRVQITYVNVCNLQKWKKINALL
jgi:hypothetical protein